MDTQVDIADVVSPQLQTSIPLDWMPDFELGLGIEAPSLQLLGTAVTPFQVKEPEGIAKDETELLFIDSEEALNCAINIDASASFNAFRVQAAFSAGWQKHVSCSRSSMTIVVRKERTWPAAKIALSEVRLTAEARKLLAESPDRFRKAYGDYFIAGYVKQARMYAVYTCKAASEDRLNAFKAEGKFSKEMFSAEGSASFCASANSHSVTVETHIVKEGSGADTGELALEPARVEAEYKAFCATAVGLPSHALLYHYCMLDSEVPRTIDVEPENLLLAQKLYRKLIAAGARAADIPRNYKRRMTDRLAAIRDAAYAEVPRDLRCDTDSLRSLVAEAEQWLNDCEEIDSYRRLWRELKRIGAGADDQGQGPRCGLIGAHALQAGAAPTKTKLVTGSYDVRPEVIYEKECGHAYKIGYLQWDPSFCNPDYRICGYEVVAYRRNNGTWHRKGGGLREFEISFHFASEYDRGMHWGVKVWGVPANKVMFDDDEL